MPTVCASPLYAMQIACDVLDALDTISDDATALMERTEQSLEDLKADSSASLSEVLNVTYNPGTSNINKTFSAPDAVPAIPDFSNTGPATPSFPAAPTVGALAAVDAAPAVPAAYVVQDTINAAIGLITQSVYDAIYNKEQARADRQSASEERDAYYAGAARGEGGSNASKNIRLAKAQENRKQRNQEVLHNKTVDQENQIREDIATIIRENVQLWPLHPQMELDTHTKQEQLEIDAYKAEEGAKTGGYEAIVGGLASAYKTQVDWVIGYLGAENQRYLAYLKKYDSDISSEAERRGWSAMEGQWTLEEAKEATGLALQKAQVILENVTNVSIAISQILGTLASAKAASMDYNASTSGKASINTSTTE